MRKRQSHLLLGFSCLCTLSDKARHCKYYIRVCDKNSTKYDLFLVSLTRWQVTLNRVREGATWLSRNKYSIRKSTSANGLVHESAWVSLRNRKRPDPGSPERTRDWERGWWPWVTQGHTAIQELCFARLSPCSQSQSRALYLYWWTLYPTPLPFSKWGIPESCLKKLKIQSFFFLLGW